MSRFWIDPPLLSWPRVLVMAAVGVVLVIAVMSQDVEQSAGETAQVSKRRPVTLNAPALDAAVIPRAVGNVAANTPRGVVEICGFGSTMPSDDDPTGFDRIPASTVQDAWQELLAVSRDHADPRVRAAGLRAEWGMSRRGRARQADASFASPNMLVTPAEDAVRERLARLAAITPDPLVYGWALDACGQIATGPVPRAPEACNQLNVEQWTRLDTRNAVPWLMLVEAASQRQDEAAAGDALYRASMAGTSDAHWGALSHTLLQALPNDLAPLQRTLAGIDLWRVEPEMSTAGSQAALRYCTAEALRDTNRRQVCNDLALVLTARARDLAGWSAGLAIGERVGWPAERLHALRMDKEMLQMSSEDNATLNNALSCAGHRHRVEWSAALSKLGEVGALRERTKTSGVPQEPLREQARRRVSRLASAAATADMAASAPR